MDQAQLWNPFIKLLVKHKISNLILFLISFSYWGSDGERNQGAATWRDGGSRRGGGGVSEDCYFKDKRSHQSKLKRFGMRFCTSSAHVCTHESTFGRPNSQGQCWAGGRTDRWGGDLNAGAKQNMWAQLNFSSSGALSQQRHVHMSESISTTPPQTHKMPVNVRLFDSHHNK